MSDSAATTRKVEKVATTTVRHLAKPYGYAQENGPHLADLRAFVTACEGLPDDLRVRIEHGGMGESGRYNVTISVTLRETIPDA